MVHQQASPIIKLIVAEIPADDALVGQLTCRPLHVLIKERFEHSGGVKTSVQGVVSSVARFEWIRGWPEDEESKPGWLRMWDWLGDWRTCYTVSRAGGLEVLKHVREQGCEWDESTCSAAADGGHLEVLKWLRANGCEWDERTCSGAAEGGHLDILKWARANGCEWDRETCLQLAQDCHHPATVAWTEANK